jgi:predicted metal-dependent TIM-barrel fold hydrolase
MLLCGSAEVIEVAYDTLNQKATNVYIQRAQQLYAVEPQRTSLFRWTLSEVEIIALADMSYHGRNNVVRVMQEIDSHRCLV